VLLVVLVESDLPIEIRDEALDILTAERASLKRSRASSTWR